MKLLLATSNPGKLLEYRALAAGGRQELEQLPRFASLPPFDEAAPTFAENAAGKALHYSRLAELPVLADDSGLVVPALDGAPGVHSARYAGAGATDADRIQALLAGLSEKEVYDRGARFVCVIAVAHAGRALGVVSDAVEGTLLDAPRGSGGFGYDPLFHYGPLGKTFAELPREQKNRISHRGKAFSRMLQFLETLE